MNKAYTALATILFFSFVVSIFFTEVYTPFSQIIQPGSLFRFIFIRIKLPVILGAMIAGFALSLSGAVMQLLLRNPLMDPYVSGTASGGAFGAVLSYFLLAFGLPFAGLAYISPLVAFGFALLSTSVTLLIGRKGGVYSLVIGGLVVGFVFSALTTILVTVLSVRFPQLPSIEFWLLGEIVYISWPDLGILFGLAGLLILIWRLSSRKIDLVAVSDEMSYARGINPGRFRLLWLAAISIAVSFLVSVVGIVGFVGIIVPHIVRRMGARGSSKIVPYSAFLGASFLGLANVISSGILGFVIPVTAITSIIAAPLIIYVLVRPYSV